MRPLVWAPVEYGWFPFEKRFGYTETLGIPSASQGISKTLGKTDPTDNSTSDLLPASRTVNKYMSVALATRQLNASVGLVFNH